MNEVGFLQVKVIKANDLPATDLNSNVSQQSTAQFSIDDDIQDHIHMKM